MDDLLSKSLPHNRKEMTKEENRGFEVDVKKQQIICPKGKRSARFSFHAKGKVSGSFAM